jgi:hypothetical protein
VVARQTSLTIVLSGDIKGKIQTSNLQEPFKSGGFSSRGSRFDLARSKSSPNIPTAATKLIKGLRPKKLEIRFIGMRQGRPSVRLLASPLPVSTLRPFLYDATEKLECPDFVSSKQKVHFLGPRPAHEGANRGMTRARRFSYCMRKAIGATHANKASQERATRLPGIGGAMYLAIVVLLMGVLPVASIIIEYVVVQTSADLLFLIGKWFVFWPIGIRLMLAGVRQVANPAFTADTIFGVKEKAALALVRELGFGNLSIGLLGALTLLNNRWIAPAAIAGGLYYGLAGVGHAIRGGRNSTENIAMVSDLLIFVVLGVCLSLAWLHGAP